MDREELLIAHRELYAQHHNHKEQMAYAATVLYLTGAAVLMFTDQIPPESAKCLKIVFIIVVFIAAFAFVAWQLRQRQIANDIVEACERILARPADGEMSPTPTDTRTYYGLHLPHFLVDEIVTVVESRTPLCCARIPEFITYVTMLAVAILVAIRTTG